VGVRVGVRVRVGGCGWVGERERERERESANVRFSALSIKSRAAKKKGGKTKEQAMRGVPTDQASNKYVREKEQERERERG
jgi:hypothetical protein